MVEVQIATKKCIKCKETKTLNEFRHRILPSKKECIEGVCQDCKKIYNHEYRQNNHEILSQKEKIYWANHIEKLAKKRHKAKLNWRSKSIRTTNGKIFYNLQKRPHPESKGCELCHRNDIILAYHHWDDDNPNLGLWVCKPCHTMCEQIDNGMDAKYKSLKKFIQSTKATTWLTPIIAGSNR